MLIANMMEKFQGELLFFAATIFLFEHEHLFQKRRRTINFEHVCLKS